MKPSTDDSDASSVDSKRFDASGPQFRAPAAASNKVVLDERFASVLTDERFQLQIQDKYGRKTKKKNAKEELSAFYTIDEADGNAQDAEQPKKIEANPKRNRKDDAKQTTSDDDQPGSSSRIAYLTALSRGQLEMSSSSSEGDSSDGSDSSSSGDDSDDDDDDGKVRVDNDVEGVLDPSSREEEIEITEEPTRYLAVTNMDWTNVRALDIYALLSSFIPASSIRRVRVFISDYGQEKLADQERFGPKGLWKDGAVDKSRVDDDESAYESEYDDEQGDGSEVPERAAYPSSENVGSDFDQEKLRSYEASKLRYYFAVAEFDSAESAEKAYREVDGMEFEHSSAEVDLRAIPEAELESVVTGRPLRDEASSIPSNYSPPDFIVSALQQTNVTCTWDLADLDREKTLTKYNSGEQWRDIAESDDLKAYLASDASSDEEEDGDKAALLRKHLGLDSDDNDSAAGDKDNDNDSSSEEDPQLSDSEEDEDDLQEGEMEFSFVPGAKKVDLTEKIQEKLSAASYVSKELTPWEKYKEKRKKKRQERRQASRKKHGEEETGSVESDDRDEASDNKAALELLVAGEEHDDTKMNFDMRELQRLEKNKDKNLKGARKRKETERAETVAGTGFDVDVSDKRFQAVLEGTDDRFGIDQTDSNFKKTPGMLKILKEQTHRRKKRRGANEPQQNALKASSHSAEQTSGAKALSAIVQSLKAKHN